MDRSSRDRGGSGHGALWASAAVLAGLVLVQAGRMRDNAALADMVVQAGEYTLLTTEAQNEELLYVIDVRTEELSIYRIGQQRSLELIYKDVLPELFSAARLSSGGR